MYSREERLEMLRLAKRNIAFMALAAGGAIAFLSTSVFVETMTNDATRNTLYSTADQVCKNDACLQYYDSITGNVKTMIAVGMVTGYSVVVFGGVILYTTRKSEIGRSDTERRVD